MGGQGRLPHRRTRPGRPAADPVRRRREGRGKRLLTCRTRHALDRDHRTVAVQGSRLRTRASHEETTLHTTVGEQSRAARRVAVIGDVGGHVDELRAELARLGADRNGRLPPDLLVVQVGDLVHRGPASDDVVALVDHYLHTQPRNWIQLVGNHEALYLRTPPIHWPHKVSRRASRTLRRWWRDGIAVLAATIETADESLLVTHAGVTAEFWSDVLDGPTTVDAAARRINELARAGRTAVFRGGVALHGTVFSGAGPLWADAGTELVPGWADRRLPFSQVHGHSTIVDWRSPTMVPYAEIHDVVVADFAAKHETVHLAGGRLVAIDPGHRDTPTTPWRALELVGSATVPR